jgi:hypothetical protein
MWLMLQIVRTAAKGEKQPFAYSPVQVPSQHVNTIGAKAARLGLARKKSAGNVVFAFAP